MKTLRRHTETSEAPDLTVQSTSPLYIKPTQGKHQLWTPANYFIFVVFVFIER